MAKRPEFGKTYRTFSAFDWADPIAMKNGETVGPLEQVIFKTNGAYVSDLGRCDVKPDCDEVICQGIPTILYLPLNPEMEVAAFTRKPRLRKVQKKRTAFKVRKTKRR